MNQLLDALVSLKEDEFTKEILKPLFEAMGYDRVEFNGGAYERGKDLIAQRRIPPMKEMFVVYIQSKKIGNSQTTRDSAKFTSLVHQLRQCCTTTIKDNEGNNIKPNLVYLACPEQIKSRFLEEVMSQMIGLNVEVRPYDGIQVINDIKEYNPELLEKLIPMRNKLVINTSSLGKNEELLQALKSDNKSFFSNYYSDLSFFVGSFDSNLLFNFEIGFLNKAIRVSESSWVKVKSEIVFLYERFNVSILVDQLEKVERDFKEWKEAFESLENKAKIRDLNFAMQDVSELSFKIESKIKEWKEDLSFSDTVKKIGLEENEKIRRLNIVHEIERFYGSDDHADLKFEFSKKESALIFYKEVIVVVDFILKRKSYSITVSNLKKEITNPPFYCLEIDCEAIENKVDNIRLNYFAGVSEINNRTMSFFDLKSFLSTTEKSLFFLSYIKRNDIFLNDFLSFKATALGQDRVSISPHDIFETKHDIAIYGGAGVGKTTTLKVYASRYAESGSKKVIYVPLNSLVLKYSSLINSEENALFLKKELIASLVLLSKGIELSESNINDVNSVLSEDATLILDGLDEVYNAIPSIIKEISFLKKNKTKLQLIVSSRDCVSYLNDISFLGITLLPFTKPQLLNFVSGWFDDSKKSAKLIDTIESKGLFKNIRTPLLATITCTLVEKGIDAPSTENEIYAQRINLLTGDYDIHKKIDRQKNTGDILKRCAKKIAFIMHRKGVRSMQKNEIVRSLKSDFGDSFSQLFLEECVGDLINPCNVLVYDPLSYSYTFGHFRYQEHLVAEEIITNRGIDIVDLLFDDWWRGALCLYAQANDISHLIESCYERFGSIKRAYITLDSMVKNVAKSKRSHLIEILNRYKEMNDDLFIIYDENDFDDWDDPNALIR